MIKDGVASLTLIAKLNFDRFFIVGAICAALFASGFMITL